MMGDLDNQFGNALSSPNFAARVSMIMLESAICEKISSYFHIFHIYSYFISENQILRSIAKYFESILAIGTIQFK